MIKKKDPSFRAKDRSIRSEYAYPFHPYIQELALKTVTASLQLFAPKYQTPETPFHVHESRSSFINIPDSHSSSTWFRSPIIDA